jgi:hypothetical protein
MVKKNSLAYKRLVKLFDQLAENPVWDRQMDA